MLKIVIDVTPIDAKPSGVGLYTLNLIKALSKLENKESFKLGLAYQFRLKNWLKIKLKLSTKEFPQSIEILKNNCDFYEISLPVKFSNIAIEYFPEFFPLYIENMIEGNNIFHGTNYTVYPFKGLTKIINIYDLAFIKYPSYIDSVVQNYAKIVKKCLTWTDIIITISESSKKDIINYLNFPEEKIFVTPLASRYNINYLDNIDQEKEIDNINYDFSKPYLLFVSTIEPRKNITGIIKAFNYLKEKYKIQHQLVLIGRKGWKFEPIFQEIETSPYNSEIHHLNYLNDKHLAIFYSKAEVFVYPSFYEGFGLPVLEAMTLGTPVVTSNTSSIPEVAGDGAILINPDEILELAEGILKVISDQKIKQDLIIKGRKQSQNFSWEKTAKETLKAYQQLTINN